MAQPQQPSQQYTMPPRPYSPPQQNSMPSPVDQQQNYGLPPNKRQRLSPIPTSSQPGSPYNQSPYAMNNALPNTAPSSGSPHYANGQLPGSYTTPYANGNGNMSPSPLHLPQTHPPNQHPPQHGSLSFPSHVPQQQQPNFNSFMPPQQQTPGTMGPPSKPVDKGKGDDLNPMDVLGGTGIDLAEEEQYTFQMYSTSFNSQLTGSQSGTISSGHSYTQFAPTPDAQSFYGSGPANQVGEKTDLSQDEFHKQAAAKAWAAAARDLAISRQRELDNPFLNVANVHKRMEKIARDNGLGLRTDNNGRMGTMKLPEDFPKPKVAITSKTGPDGTMVETYGVFIPEDSLLVDQLALISISTKHRLRGLLEDASKLAKGRQVGSHGLVPAEWADSAVANTASSQVIEGAPRSGWESAVSPRTNPLKRSLSNANGMPTPDSDGTKTPINPPKFASNVAVALRSSASKEREAEEARLAKRARRALGGTDGVASRQGSVLPGTPGSVAPESIESLKPPTKKEQKKKAEAKVSEAASHHAANQTTAQFLGGGSSLFGKKKKNYSWMNAGAGSGSGASTPGRLNTQGLSMSGGGAANNQPEKLTHDGVRRLGQWREDKEKGRDVQMRDWVTVLEDDGREKKALQKAYLSLDHSEPK